MIGRIIAIILVLLILLAGPVIGVYFACSCHRSSDNCDIDAFLGWGMLAILGCALLNSVFFVIATGSTTAFYAGFSFAFTVVLLTLALTNIAASFVCSTSGAVWYNSIPALALVFFAFIHLIVQGTGKLRGPLYRYIFALSYTLLFTVCILLFLFTPALAFIPDPVYSWIPFTFFILLTFSGLYQSWASPRPLTKWEVVTLDLPHLLGKQNKLQWIKSNFASLAEKTFAKTSPNEYFNLRQAKPLDLPRVTMGSISFDELRSEHDSLWRSTVTKVLTSDSPKMERVESETSSTTDTLTVVQITDPHLGSLMTVERLRECCERTVELQPDLVFLTGDFFTMEATKEPHALITALEPLKNLPANRVFACYGNHDFESPDITSFTDAGVKSCGGILLTDETTTVPTRAGLVEIIGISFYGNPAEPMARFFEKRQSAPTSSEVCQRFVMLHDPKGFPFVPPDLNAVVLSGHTHGGHIGLYQLGLPHVSMVRLSGTPDNGEWTNVNYQIADGQEECLPPMLGNILYVHRGQGSRSDLSNALTRLGVPSEDSVLRVKVTGSTAARASRRNA